MQGRKMLTSECTTGKFVSESKFRDHPAAFIPHIQSRNRAALEGLITKPEVEKKLLQRLRKKANLYAINFTPDGEPLNDSATRKIDVDGVVELYEHYIIPLTKEVEVRLRFAISAHQLTLTDWPLTLCRWTICWCGSTGCRQKRSRSWWQVIRVDRKKL